MRISDWSSDVCSSDLTLIRASAEDESEPAKLMERVNNRLAENNPNLMFVTLIIAVLDLETGELNWTSAGHLPPCVISASGELRLLDGRGGPACGVQEGLPYAPLSTSPIGRAQRRARGCQ